MNKSITGLLKKISLLVFIGFVALLLYINFPFIFLKNDTCIFIYTQESFRELTKDIIGKTHYVSPVTLKIYSKLTHLDRHLEAGEYCFSDHDSILTIMRKIARAGRELHKFTLVDGWTYSEMIQHLKLAPSLSELAVIDNKKTISIALKLQENNLEGQFYPDTYYYAYPDTALEILLQAHELMKKRTAMLYQDSQAHVFFKSPYELLIAASIIQKEASDPIDQMFVASVLVNRLKQHMKLQMDPTVIYGLGENFHSHLSKQDLKNNSFYNTYVHTGLPPAPICMPGETALFAAAHPKESNFLYFVSKKNGAHQFSETLSEQTLAINKYLLHQSPQEHTNETHE